MFRPCGAVLHRGVVWCGLVCSQLVNESTVVSLTREMLNYLVVSTPEQKGQLCDKISASAER